MLDFRIETFITVCKYMNYTRAAEDLHITQPAVSQHIHYVEQDYGIKLFEFKGKKMFLTPQGAKLLSVATTLKHDEQALHRMFREEKKGRNKLIFGVTMTIGEYIIGNYLAGYIKRYPDTEVKLMAGNTEELLGKLDEGELDFALVEGFFEKKNYDYEVFSREKYIGVISPKCSLAGKKDVKFEDILKLPFIIREKGSGTREVIERALSDKGYGVEDFQKVMEITSIAAIKTMVENNLGITFLYETAVKKELNEGSLVPVQIEGFPLYHDFTFIWRKDSIFGANYQELLQDMTRE